MQYRKNSIIYNKICIYLHMYSRYVYFINIHFKRKKYSDTQTSLYQHKTSYKIYYYILYIYKYM